MRGKGSVSHSEGCCTGYIALEEAVMAVASGMYDIVLSGCSEQGTGMADVFEAVTQMRGEAGERQVKKLPKHTFLRGFGGAQNVRAIILRSGF